MARQRVGSVLPGFTLMDVRIDYASLIGALACRLLGEPNPRLSSPSQLRFGNLGSIAVEIAGEKKGTWYDHERGEGGGALELVKREKRLTSDEAQDWFRREFHSVVPLARRKPPMQGGSHIIATYDYCGLDGTVLFQVVRYEPKQFRQRRPDGQGDWIWNVQGVPPVLYRLPQLLASAGKLAPVFVVEGEKDVEALTACGLVATCNPGGAGSEPKSGKPYKSKWPASFGQYFVGRDVVILPDNDDVGRSHAEAVANSLLGSAARIRIVNLPDLAPKGDVSDWLAGGRTVEHINDLVARAPNFTTKPETVSSAGPTTPDEKQIWLGVGSDVEIARRVTTDLEKQFGELVCCEAAVWCYDQTHWTTVPDETLWLTSARYDGALFDTPEGKTQAVKLSKARVESILACMRPAMTRRDFFDTAPVGINCTSGFIRFDSHGQPSLEPHNRDHRCRHVLPGRWPILSNTEHRADSLFTRLLGGCFKEDDDKQQKIDLLAEVAGIAALGFATRMVSPKALVLKGEKAENGKSQVLDVLRSLLPQLAVSSISPSKFHDRTFACHLADKLLNAPDELAGSDAIASEIFKQIITGEPLTTRDVHKSAAAFRPVAQHVFATNNLPTFKSGMDRGVRRRLMVLTFNRVIPKEERIERIGQRIGIEEGDQLLAWAVNGASRVLKNKEFTEPTSSAEALREWMLSSDPVLGWLDSDEVEFSVNAFVPRVRTKTAYANFRVWAVAEGYSADRLPAVNGFSQRVVAGAAERGVIKTRTFEGSMFVGLAPVRSLVDGR